MFKNLATKFLFSTWAWADLTCIDKYSKELEKVALVSLETSTKLNGLNKKQINNMLPNMPIEKTIIEKICPINTIIDCIPGKFRSYSGHCNNIEEPLWGAVYEPFQRLQPPNYFDSKFNFNFFFIQTKN